MPPSRSLPAAAPDPTTSDEVKAAVSPYLAELPGLDLGMALTDMRATMQRVIPGAAGMFLLFAAIGALLPRPVLWPFIAIDLLFAALLGVASVAIQRWPPTMRQLHVGGYALALLCAAHAVLSSHFYRDPHDAVFIVFLLFGIGAVAIDAGLSIALMVLLGAAHVAVAAEVGAPGEWIGALVLEASALLLSVALLIGRRETLAHTARLRAAERDLAARLARELSQREEAERRRAEAEARLWQAQKLEALGTLAGGVAHDINNMLAAIVGVAELARLELPEGSPAHADFGHILSASRRGAQLTTNLLGFARRGKRRDEPFLVDEIVEEAVSLLARTAPKDVTVVVAPGAPDAVVQGDATQIDQALVNVCLNAIEALGGRGTVRVSTSCSVLGDGDSAVVPAGRYVTIEVKDDGAGMSAETLAHAFEPFYSSKGATSHHSGLGLAMVFGTLRDHRGEVLIESAVGVGTRVQLRLPRADVVLARAPRRVPLDEETPPPERPAPRPTGPQGAPSEPRVLVVDDEPMVRRAVARLLASAGLEAVPAASGAEAVELFRDHPETYALVLLDLAMPGMNGAECIAALRAIDPSVPVLLASGYPKNQRVEELLAAGRVSFLAKPFDRATLVEAVRTTRRAGSSRPPAVRPAEQPRI